MTIQDNTEKAARLQRARDVRAHRVANEPGYREKMNAYYRDRYHAQAKSLPKRASRFIDWNAVQAAFDAGDDHSTVMTKFGITAATLRTSRLKGKVAFERMKPGRRPKPFYTVDLDRTLEDVHAFLKSTPASTDLHELVTPECDWCAANLKAWTSYNPRSMVVDGEMIARFTFEFDTAEEASLFKLFHGGVQ